MKKHQLFQSLFLIGFLFFFNYTSQNALNAQSKSTTFQVCEVDKASTPPTRNWFYSESYREVIIEKMVNERNREDRAAAIQKDTSLKYFEKHKFLEDNSYQPGGVPVRKIEAFANKDVLLFQTGFHPFMATMHMAYAQHYPMTISPDMIWLLIAQGFANHVNENAEAMRSYFVDFDGKKQIDVRRNKFKKGDENNDWPGAFKEFSEKIEENTGAALLDLITGDFSTTGPIEKAAFQITLMDAMKSYFEYSMTTTCGIPEITLEGTVEDWKAIEIKAEEMAQYDLEWWIDDLLPILKEFTKAASGNPDTEFWESIYKWKNPGSGSPYITGWILRFFPYKDRNGKLVQVISRKSESDGQKINYNLSATTDQLTSGLSQADFLWNYHDTFYKMEFVAGFVGCQQDPKTLSLRPEISWAVIDKQEKASAEEIENYKEGGNKEYRKGIKKQ